MKMVKINMISHRFGFVFLGMLLTGVVAPLSASDVGASMNGPATFPQQDGAALFQAICQGCHQSNAEGAIGAGAYPALAQNINLAAAAYPILTVLKGRRSMPPLASYLSDAQIAAVVTYVRTHFGNNYLDVVSPVMVRAARETH
jgi:mono/diheme cytochrome c family protein